MNYNKLSLKSKKMLYDVLKSENPVEMLEKRFKDISLKEEMELRSIIKELRKFGYINVNWADDIPYYITINNAAINYKEKLQENKEVENLENLKLANKSKIFISHRTSDKNIADALLDFFVATGISREKVFCSSLPGNDVKENIPMEIKEAIKNSCLNIAILSNEYYESAYCLNEAGILWFQDVTVIPIALPEIKPENMIGFLNSGYKIRRLDNSDDIAYIYDIVCEKSDSHQSKTSVVNVESRKLIDKYKEIISYRPQIQKHEINKQFEITTDDERIVLYYLLLNQVRKVAKNKMINWLQDDEVYGVDVSNAFDLLSSLGNSRFDNETLELSIDVFREYSRNSSEIINDLRLTVDEHIELASKKFKKMWDEKSFDDHIKLFVAYIVDEKIDVFGNRWMAKEQIEDIKKWEDKYNLDFTLSSNYGKCLSLFVYNRFVFESDWTSQGNTRAYKLCKSLKELLFNNSIIFFEELNSVKNAHQEELPF